MANPLKKRQPDPYEADFHAWCVEQAAMLRARRADALDWENLAEEIETLGRSERREIRSRLIVLLAHLLKWAHQPERRTRSWLASIAGARDDLHDVLSDNPSLRRHPAEILPRAYGRARDAALVETGLGGSSIPALCPYSIDQILDPAFLPGPAEPRFDD